MPSVRAASSALPRSREAIAVTSLHTPFCMPGMTFVTAIFAVLRIPQRTLDIARHHSRKVLGGKTCAGQKSASGKFSQPVVSDLPAVSPQSFGPKEFYRRCFNIHPPGGSSHLVSIELLHMLVVSLWHEDHVARRSAHGKWRARDRRQCSRACVQSESRDLLRQDADVYELPSWIHSDGRGLSGTAKR